MKRHIANTVKPIFFTLFIGGLSGCQNNPHSEERDSSENAPQVHSVTKVDDKSFDADTLYALLVAEIAIDRKRYDIALGNYIQQATNTRDPSVAARATQIARGLNARQPALEMAKLWAEVDPTDQDANIIAVNELIQADEFIEAVRVSSEFLEKGNQNTIFDRIAVAAETKGDLVVDQLTNQYAQLLKKHPKKVDLWIGYSVLLLQHDQQYEALKAAQQAKHLEKDGIASTFQECRVLQKMGRADEANHLLAQLVKKHPDNIALRARYARILWATHPEEAEKQFEELYAREPNDPEILFSLALVKSEREKNNEAIELYKKLLTMDEYADSAQFQLGKIYESEGDIDSALTHYQTIKGGQNYAAAIIRITDIFNSDEDYKKSLTYIDKQKAQLPANSPELETLYLIEADIYSRINQMKSAEKALTGGIQLFPDSTRLLYARAMLFTQLDYISAAIEDLKNVIKITPNNAAALNALGYTMADKTRNIDEASRYVEKAYTLKPDDPAIIDSMGWVAFRRGNLPLAEEFLQKAMEAYPDHEIAAHLGEVLWTAGKVDEAKAVWLQGLELQPESVVIIKTLNRLNVSLSK